MANLSRRQFVASAPIVLGGASLLSACSLESIPEGYEAAAKRIRRAGPLVGTDGEALSQELVRYATLAPSSHNTQCWKFAIERHAITILPDPLRRCPAVDPDEHHVFVSLGCAAENLVHSALARGLRAEAGFDASREAIRVDLRPTRAEESVLFNAIPVRQCTRGDYDSIPLSTAELGLLERAGTSDTVRMLLITERPAMERGQHRANGGCGICQGTRELDPLQRSRCGSCRRWSLHRMYGQPEYPDVVWRSRLRMVL